MLPKQGDYFNPELSAVVSSLGDGYVTVFDSENVVLLKRRS